MKFNAFVTLWNVKNKKNDENGKDLLQRIMKNEYVPIEEKQVRAENIIKNTSFIKNSDGTEKLHVNSVARHLFTFLTVIDMYTTVEIDFKDAVNEYNELVKNGAMDAIFGEIPDRELKEFRMVLDFVASDLLTNEYENHAFIKSQVERFGNLVGNVIGPIIEGLDLNKIQEVIENISK